MKRARARNPDRAATGWSISVTDGNGDEWLYHSPDCPIGPITKSRGDMTPEAAVGILRALEATVRHWQGSARDEFKGPAKVMPLPRRKPD
jgi:hypothetical protein